MFYDLVEDPLTIDGICFALLLGQGWDQYLPAKLYMGSILGLSGLDQAYFWICYKREFAFFAINPIFEMLVFRFVGPNKKVRPLAVRQFVGLFFSFGVLDFRICQHGGSTKNEAPNRCSAMCHNALWRRVYLLEMLDFRHS
ncbi:hypothetical protein NQF87_01755 [Bombella sp. TMW 2.2559]|uniref:Uncharacterized protein n=1 Tax=Bombella dulcis TaxID=2967339 RepID=A0ABT3W9V5_9PROT|nr:hypothetical protein [Bombella dulcis]MCX5615706.1 hypothetical protein [Bombella dulcis]